VPPSSRPSTTISDASTNALIRRAHSELFTNPYPSIPKNFPGLRNVKPA
jgi:hypothetical protein